jgi:hypothetical protein
MSNVVALKSGAQAVGIVPTNIEEAYRLANAIHQSGMAPKDLNSPEKCMVAIMQGLELGLPPMFAINKIAVINGRPTLWGDAIPALLQSRGFKLTETHSGEGDARAAVCLVTRPDGSTYERRFSVGDAKVAGLWGKAGPWKAYPDRMLQMRARGFAARDGAADVLGGLYLREEIEEEQMRDITPTAELPLPPPIPEETFNEEKFLDDLQAMRRKCDSVEDVEALRESVKEWFDTLSEEGRKGYDEILSVEE